MASRRDLLRALGVGAAAAVATTAGARLDAAARADQLRAFADGGAASSPWWLLAPLQAGSPVGKGWTLTSLGAVERGAAVITLAHADGREARVHLCARVGRARGLAHTALFDLVLMDGRHGDAPTDEGLGRALIGLAGRVHRNELSTSADLGDVARLLPHRDRVSLYGAASLV
jgi:hypothetical protein